MFKPWIATSYPGVLIASSHIAYCRHFREEARFIECRPVRQVAGNKCGGESKQDQDAHRRISSRLASG